MGLLDRYLKAIEWWLPRRQKRDILAELAEDVRSQVEDREAELGRKLSELELEAMLEQRGHPILVAERYLPAEHLIGPTLFPVYRKALKAVLFLYLVPWLLVWVSLVSFVPSYRAAHPGFSLIETLWTWVEIAVYAFTAITVTFAVLDRSKRKSKLFARWNPRNLPTGS